LAAKPQRPRLLVRIEHGAGPGVCMGVLAQFCCPACADRPSPYRLWGIQLFGASLNAKPDGYLACTGWLGAPWVQNMGKTRQARSLCRAERYPCFPRAIQTT